MRFLGVVNRWEKKTLRGSLQFNKHIGELTIGRTGYYYVYSQMYYYDCTTYLLSHYTLVNNNKILASTSSVVGCSRKYNTNYQGGVFLLNRGDKVSVSVELSKVYYMKPAYSYFGVFMLHT